MRSLIWLSSLGLPLSPSPSLSLRVTSLISLPACPSRPGTTLSPGASPRAWRRTSAWPWSGRCHGAVRTWCQCCTVSASTRRSSWSSRCLDLRTYPDNLTNSVLDGPVSRGSSPQRCGVNKYHLCPKDCCILRETLVLIMHSVPGPVTSSGLYSSKVRCIRLSLIIFELSK